MAVLGVVQQKQRLIEKHLLGFTSGNDVLFVFSTVSIIPVET